MKKKFLALALSAVLSAGALVGLASCNGHEKSDRKLSDPVAKEDIKVGLICLHDSNSTYDANFINAMKRAFTNLGLNEKTQLVMKTGIPEDNTCQEEALDMADNGCQVVFADSFGHEKWILNAAKEVDNVRFCHATGTTAHTEKLDNFSNAFASIYEGRYLAGVAAGMKLKELKDAGSLKTENFDTNNNIKIGYIGAFTYAEVISGYTSFYLGVKSVVSNVVMDVQFTGSWYDEAAEKTAAETLIGKGSALISQHADSWGAPKACEAAGIPNVSYNGSTVSQCPETAIISSAINWTPYFEYMINSTIQGKIIDKDWCGGLGDTAYTGTEDLTDGSVVLSALGKNAAKDTAAAIEKARTDLKAGTINVFDTSKFTVTVADKLNVNATIDENGKLLTYKADVDFDAAFTGDTQVVADGAFKESKYRSAPYFDVQIDGITLLNVKF